MIVAPPPKLALFVHFSCDSQAGIHAQKRTPLHNPTARITKRTQFVPYLQQTPPERHKNAYTPEEGSPRRPLAVSPALTSTPCVDVGALRAPWRAQLAFRGLQCRLEERMFTATADLILPSTTTGSFPRPRGRPHILTSNQRGRGKDPVVVLGRIRSAVAVNMRSSNRHCNPRKASCARQGARSAPTSTQGVDVRAGDTARGRRGDPSSGVYAFL